MKDRLGNHIQQVRGVSYKPNDLSETLSDGYTTLLRANNISEGKINFDSVQFVSSSKVSPEQILKPNDILVCSSSGSLSLVGKSALYKKTGEHTFGAFCKVVRATGKLLPQYIAFYMCSQAYRRHIENIANGANINNLRNEHLDEILLSIPSEDKQNAIIAKLEKVESVISHRRTQLAKLDELVKCRFVEMFGVIIPDNTYVKLGDVCDIERGGSPRPIANYITNEDNGINWIKIGDTTTDRYILSAAEKIRPEGARKSRFVYAGDLLLSNSMSFGHPFILKINGCIHDGWLVLHFEKSILNTIYLHSYLSMPEVYNIFSNMAVGGVVNNLNKDMVKKLPILVPPMSLQEKFETFVQRIDKLRIGVQAALDKAQTLFDSLMQEYFG